MPRMQGPNRQPRNLLFCFSFPGFEFDFHFRTHEKGDRRKQYPDDFRRLRDHVEYAHVSAVQPSGSP